MLEQIIDKITTVLANVIVYGGFFALVLAATVYLLGAITPQGIVIGIVFILIGKIFF